MVKGTAIKVTKTYEQRAANIQDLATSVQSIVDNSGIIVSILTTAPNAVEILFVTSKWEEVEVDVPDELDALDQADGAVN